jgi:hypothetical protein
VDEEEEEEYGSSYDDQDEILEETVRRILRRVREDPGYGTGAEDAASSTVYSFTPSRMSRAASTQPGGQSDGELPENSEHDAATASTDARTEPDRGLRLSHVIQSQYNGDHMQGGSHGVKLTTVLSSRPRNQPLFRWQHCTRNFMDFGDFSREAMRAPDLTSTEQKCIRDLLSRIQRKFVKTVQTANGRSVLHMEPSCIQHMLPTDGSFKASGLGRRTVTWICLPYFTLEKYSGLQGAAGNQSAFPIETLLQAKFSRAAKERDMNQAVRRNKDTPEELCFHVAQIWCLVIGNSFLLTYGRMTEDTLRGDCITLSTEPAAAEQTPDARPSPTTFTVIHGQAVAWSISVDECNTWLSFLAHFREFWPRRLQFFRRKRPVTAEDWPRTLRLIKYESNAKVVLEMRIGCVLPF